MPLPFDLDQDGFQRERILAAAGMDLARISVCPEEENNSRTAAYADFHNALNEQEREVLWYWFDLFHPVPWPRDPLSVWLRANRV